MGMGTLSDNKGGIIVLKFSFSGADGTMIVPETLTSGMVGKQVEFSFSDEWSGLKKIAVFTAGNVTRDAVVDGNAAVIPSEVLERAMRQLYVGVYGVSVDGKVVIPTIRVKGPFIQPGADPSGDPGLNPELAVWAQILSDIGELDNLKTQAKDNLVEAINELTIRAGTGLTDTEKTLMLALFQKTAYTDDVSEAYRELERLWGNGENDSEEDPEENVHTHSYTSKVTKAATCVDDGERRYTCSCGDSYTVSIPATGHHYVNGVCTVCGAADPAYNPDVTLTGISATYSGGEVYEGTDVSDLTGIVVTAHYSDGSTETVSGYTLSGTIAEGSNTITVSYGGMTSTFIVTGIAVEEEPENGDLLYHWDLTSSLTDTIGNVTATLSGSAKQDANGVTINGAGGSCYFGDAIFSPGRTVEIDISAASFAKSSGHGFLIMINTSGGANGTGTEGLTYRWGSEYLWQLYAASAWQTPAETIHDGNIIAGKTIRFCSVSETEFSVYFDDTLFGTVKGSSKHATKLQIGSASNAFYNVTVTAVRVYKEVA